MIQTLYTHMCVIAMTHKENILEEGVPLVSSEESEEVLVRTIKAFKELFNKTPSEIHMSVVSIKQCPRPNKEGVGWALVVSGEFVNLCLLYDGEVDELNGHFIDTEVGQPYIIPKKDCVMLPKWDWEEGGWYWSHGDIALYI